MKRLFASALVLACMGSASAADLTYGRDQNLFSSAPAATWTGFYAGAQIGYAWGSDQVRVEVPGFPFTFIAPEHDVSGFVGGVHAGFNFQTGLTVFGIEGDLELAGVDGKVDLTGSGDFPGYGIASETSIDFQGSLRARVGLALLDRMMIYATGGLAFANVENTYAAALPRGNVFGAPAGIATASFDETRWGWTLGAGAEYALTGNITTRLEYRYTSFGSYENATGFLSSGSVSEQDPDFHTVRLGASYRF